MRTLTLLLIFAATIAVPLAAQEEESPQPPSIMTVSSYQCPQSAIAEITENYDRYTRPVEEELVEEGLLAGAGLYFHWWADQWNVNYYRMGYDLGDIMDAIVRVGEIVLERNPELEDQPGPFDVCTAHKDGIYTIGPGTGRPLPPEGGN